MMRSTFIIVRLFLDLALLVLLPLPHLYRVHKFFGPLSFISKPTWCNEKKTWVFTCRMGPLGEVKWGDSKEELHISCTGMSVGDLTGDLLLDWAKKSLVFTGRYGATEVGYSYDGNHLLQLSQKSLDKRFFGTLKGQSSLVLFEMNCKRLSHGLCNLQIRGQVNQHLLRGSMRGFFYNQSFFGTVTGDLLEGKGLLRTSLSQPIKLERQGPYLNLTSEQLEGRLNLLEQRGYLQLRHPQPHFLTLQPSEFTVMGPQVCISFCTSPYTQIVGPSLIYPGDLLQTILRAESLKKSSGQPFLRLMCENFGLPRVKARIFGNKNRMYALFERGRERLVIRTAKRNLHIYCSNLASFQNILGRFVITSGRLKVNAIKLHKVWRGDLQAVGARIASRYQPPGIPRLWKIRGNWSSDGQTIRFHRVRIFNSGAEVRVHGQVDRQKLSLQISFLRKNTVTRLVTHFTSPYKMGLASKFSVKGYLGREKFAANKANLLLGWISFLPI